MGGRLAWLCVAMLHGGCDRLFDLDPLADAAVIGDAPPVADAHTPIVTPGCWDMFFQGDEDEDEIVDGCDVCPLDRDVEQRDGDGDGIGDVCDPNPAHPIERRAFFDPMVNLNRDNWQIVGVGNHDWRVADITGYGIKQNNRGLGSQTVDSTLRTIATFEQPSIQVMLRSGTPDDYDADTSAIGAYIVVDPPLDAEPYGVACGVEYPGVTNTTQQGYGRITADAKAAEVSTFPIPLTRSQIRIVTQRPELTPDQPVVPACVLRHDSGVSTATFTGEIIPTQARVALWTLNASAVFVGILIYERRL